MKCKTIIYIGLGEAVQCREEAVALVDAGTKHEVAVCAECAKYCYPTRLTYLPQDDDLTQGADCEQCSYGADGGETIVCCYYGPHECEPFGQCAQFEPRDDESGVH